MKLQFALLLVVSSSFIVECIRGRSHFGHQRSGHISDDTGFAKLDTFSAQSYGSIDSVLTDIAVSLMGSGQHTQKEARSRLHAAKKRQDPQVTAAGQSPVQGASTQAPLTTTQAMEPLTTTQAVMNPQVAITTESTPAPAVIYMSTSAPEEGSGEESGSGSGSGSGLEESTTQFVQTSQAPVSPTAQPMTTTTMAYEGAGGSMAVTYTTSLPIPVGPSATVSPQYTTFDSSSAAAPQNVQTYSQTYSQAPGAMPAAGPVAAPAAPTIYSGTANQPISADDGALATTTSNVDVTQAWAGETPIDSENAQDATLTVPPTHKRKLASRRSHHKGYTASEHHKSSTHKKGKTSHAFPSSHGRLAHHKSKVAPRCKGGSKCYTHVKG